MNNTTHIRMRLIADAVLFFAVLFTPWWLISIAVFLSIVYFKNFYEAFFFGLLFDMLCGANMASLYGFRFIFSSVFLTLIFTVDFLKGKIRV